MPVDILSQFGEHSMLFEAAPSLRTVKELDVKWMNGVFFFMKSPVKQYYGHVNITGSPYALTLIVEDEALWPLYKKRYSYHGEVKATISVIISDWTTPGVLHDVGAAYLTDDQIYLEVIHQVNRGLGINFIDRSEVLYMCVDKHIEQYTQNVPSKQKLPRYNNKMPLWVNTAPLMANKLGEWDKRPPFDGKCELQNFFLSTDYVQSEVVIPCTDSANASAKCVSNSILQQDGYVSPDPQLLPDRVKIYLIERPFESLYQTLTTIDSWLLHIFPHSPPLFFGIPSPYAINTVGTII